MANKYRKKQSKAPYRKFTGQGTSTTAGEPDPGELVYLGYQKKKLMQCTGFTTPALPFKLPLELMHLIASFLEPADCLPLLYTSKLWHICALREIYKQPKLGPRNFPKFVDAICARKDLSALVRDLDLSRTIQVGRNSWTARILRKCQDNLLRFVASQSHFGFSPLMALRSCTQLRILDLAYVSETVDLSELFDAVQGFQDLEVIRFPRCSVLCDKFDFIWPSNLTTLALAGGISADFVAKVPLPSHIKHLEFHHCPFVTTRSLLVALATVGPQLHSLTVQYPMPLLSSNALDTVLILCPNLRRLNASVEYASSAMLEEEVAAGHPLQTLSLYASGMLLRQDKLCPEDLVFAMDHMLELSTVSLAMLLGYNSKTDEMFDELAERLDDRGGGLYLQ